VDNEKHATYAAFLPTITPLGNGFLRGLKTTSTLSPASVIIAPYDFGNQ
jgi:hypothetical protein